jgi:adenosylmethionine-8-amino-7-oxononanoate aminotransferase
VSSPFEHIVLDFMQMQEFAKDPFIIERGEGIRVTDSHGKPYIDGLSGVFVASLGYGNRAVIEAMTAQLERLHFGLPLHATTPPALALAEELRRHWAPPGLNTVKLLSGGSEATEAAMKLARQYHVQTGHPRKYKIISKYGGYHGATLGALSASGGWERKSLFEPLGAGFLHVHPPYCYRCPFDQQYGSCGLTSANLIERTIRAEDPETVAAVIMEPISVSSAGYVVPPPEFFAILRETCDRHNVVLIFDEIITGFGRLGRRFGADHYGVVPDLICCGKGMSGGYAPLAAVLIADRLQEAFLGTPEERVEFHHGHTFGGNPVAAAAGLAALGELRCRNLVQNAAEQGAYLRERLEAMAGRSAIIGDVRGAGLLQGLELVRDRRTREPFTDAAPGKVVDRLARERGLLLRCGTEFVVCAPPLIVTRQDIDAICAIIEECLALAERELLPVP